MKKLLIVNYIIILSLLVNNNPVYGQGMDFATGNWAEVKALAAKQKKNIFVDAYTSWCAPCKWMANTIFTQKEVGKFYNQHFINYKIDVEKGEGPTFAKENGVQAYPTFLYFDAQGNLLHKATGSKPAEKFIKDGEQALDPTKQYFTLKKQYETTTNRSPELLYNYALAMQVAGAQPYPVIQEYLKTQKVPDLLTYKNWVFISTLINWPKDPAFDFVISHKADYYKVEKPERVDDYVVSVLLEEIFDIAGRNDSVALLKLKDKIEEYGPINLDKHFTLIDYIFLMYNNGSENDEQFYQTAVRYLDTYAKDEVNELNNAAWVFFQKYDSPQRLKKAVEWVEHSIKIEKNSFSCETYANLLYKLGNKTEAYKWAEEAQAIANRHGAQTNLETQNILQEKQKQKK